MAAMVLTGFVAWPLAEALLMAAVLAVVPRPAAGAPGAVAAPPPAGVGRRPGRRGAAAGRRPHPAPFRGRGARGYRRRALPLRHVARSEGVDGLLQRLPSPLNDYAGRALESLAT